MNIYYVCCIKLEWDRIIKFIRLNVYFDQVWKFGSYEIFNVSNYMSKAFKRLSIILTRFVFREHLSYDENDPLYVAINIW